MADIADFDIIKPFADTDTEILNHDF